MEPYLYPVRPHRRRHGPQGYDNVESFRPWLRDEFTFRCVYCLEREQWTNPIAAFQIDHFVAIAIWPIRALSYDNLLYACRACNAVKGDQRIPDPLSVLISSAVEVLAGGRLKGLTKEARRLIDLMALGRPAYRRRRRLMMDIISLAKNDPALYRDLLGFPYELPNLARLRPPKNTRPGGVAQCCFARRQKGTLAEIY